MASCAVTLRSPSRISASGSVLFRQQFIFHDEPSAAQREGSAGDGLRSFARKLNPRTIWLALYNLLLRFWNRAGAQGISTLMPCRACEESPASRGLQSTARNPQKEACLAH